MGKLNLETLAALVEILASRPLLTRKDLARHFGVCLGTINNWHNDGTLPPAVYVNRGCKGRFGPLWRALDIERVQRAELFKRAKRKATVAQSYGKK